MSLYDDDLFLLRGHSAGMNWGELGARGPRTFSPVIYLARTLIYDGASNRKSKRFDTMTEVGEVFDKRRASLSFSPECSPVAKPLAAQAQPKIQQDS